MTIEDPKKPRQDSESPFRHWENGTNGAPVQVQSATPMNNEQQLLNDKKVFAKSLSLEERDAYKEAIASGDPAKMAAFKEHLTEAQRKMLNEIENRDPMTLVKGVTKMAGMMAGLEIAQDPGSFLQNLLGSGVVGRQSNVVAAATAPTQGPGVDASLKVAKPAPVFEV